jgi:malate/lactate dehydrogenase
VDILGRCAVLRAGAAVFSRRNVVGWEGVEFRQARAEALVGAQLRNGSYGIPDGVMYGVPVTCANGKYERIKGLEIDEFSRGKMDNTLKELEEERAGMAHLLK